MSFDSAQTVASLVRVARSIGAVHREKQRLYNAGHRTTSGVQALTAIQTELLTCSQLLLFLRGQVANDRIGRGDGGIHELLFRAMRQVLLSELNVLLPLINWYDCKSRLEAAWHASAQQMLSLLARNVDEATSIVMQSRVPIPVEAGGEASAAQRRRDAAREAFDALKKLAFSGRLIRFLRQGMLFLGLPAISTCCLRIYYVLTAGLPLEAQGA